MPDELKEILQRELEELKQNKIRVGILAGCLVILLSFWISDDSSDGEEIILDEPPLTKDLPVKVLPVAKSPDGMKIVLGANADRLFIGDPFAVEEKVVPVSEPSPPSEPLPKISAAPVPMVTIPPPPKS